MSRHQGLSVARSVVATSGRLPFFRTDWRFARSSLLHTGNAQNTSPQQQQDSNQVAFFFFFFSRRAAMPSLLLPCHLIASSKATSRASTPTTIIRPLSFRTLAQNQSLKARRLVMARTAAKSGGSRAYRLGAAVSCLSRLLPVAPAQLSARPVSMPWCLKGSLRS